MPAETRILSDFVSGARRAGMPADVFDLARLCVLDTVGAMLIGATKPWSQMVSAFSVGEGGSGEGACTVVGNSRRTSPQMAALANGTMGHGFEIDDVHDESLTHPGVVVVPAAMAVAEESGASGADFIMSVVLGYELNGRAGLGVGAVAHMLGGFYPTGTSGVFGSAAAAARLLGLSSEKTAHAFGIAGSMASGIVECAESGGMVKRMHAGRAAEGGVTAAYLARRGFTGPTTVLEGKFGFCQTFSDKPALDLLLNGLGTTYKIRETTVKPYACCSDIHPVIDALLEIKSKHAFAPSTVKQIVVEGPKKICALNNIDGTTSMMAAQYSVPFITAIALSEDIRDPTVYQDSILSRTDLAALQRKVEMQVDEEFDRLFPKRIAARVTVTLDDGRKLVATNRGAVGSIHNPMSQAQMEAKFMALAGPILPDETADEVMRLIHNIEDSRSIAPLTSLLRFDIGAGRKAAPAVARA